MRCPRPSATPAPTSTTPATADTASTAAGRLVGQPRSARTFADRTGWCRGVASRCQRRRPHPDQQDDGPDPSVSSVVPRALMQSDVEVGRRPALLPWNRMSRIAWSFPLLPSSRSVDVPGGVVEELLERIAGVDIGRRELRAASGRPTRCRGSRPSHRVVGTTTPDLLNLVVWLRGLAVTHVAMESTGGSGPRRALLKLSSGSYRAAAA
jgi:hypothetical protein